MSPNPLSKLETYRLGFWRVYEGRKALRRQNRKGYFSSSCDFLKDKLRRECEFMRWVSSAKNIPMLQVHYYDARIDTPYMVTDKCEGNLLIDAFGILPFETKVVFPHCIFCWVDSLSRYPTSAPMLVSLLIYSASTRQMGSAVFLPSN